MALKYDNLTVFPYRSALKTTDFSCYGTIV